MLGERKDRFVEEACSPGEKVDSRPKEPTPNSPGFAQSWNRDKKKGLHAGEGGNLLFSDMIVLIT